MNQTCGDAACGIRNLCDDLDRIGCGRQSTWLAVLLFVRDLVRHFTLFTESGKHTMQQFVFGALAKRDPSEEHLRHVLQGLEGYLANNVKTVSLREELEAEKAAANSLAESVSLFLRDSLVSEQERGRLLRRFGQDAMDTLGSGDDQSAMLLKLRTLVTEMLAHYREEAKSWEQKATALEQALLFDPLLAPLHNRRSLDDHLEQAIARAEREQTALSVLMVDVDRFKTDVNDAYGHAVGDDVLRTLAGIVNDHAGRHGWFAARYGGDELVLVCPLDGKAAAFQAEALRLAVSRCEVRSPSDGRPADTPVRFTVSIGVATHVPGMTARDMMDAADKAMYRVKVTGRNNVAQFSAEADGAD